MRKSGTNVCLLYLHFFETHKHTHREGGKFENGTSFRRFYPQKVMIKSENLVESFINQMEL